MARVPYRTFYDVLGVSQDANHDAIKIAYKKMSRRCHPDKNPGNARAVAWQQEVNKAYETLCDATARLTYDAKLPSQPRVPNPFAPQYTWNGFDGAWGMPSPSPRQSTQYYHPRKTPTTDDYWGGIQARAGFDGAWGVPSSGQWQPAGHYHSKQKTTGEEHWGGPQAWQESPAYDFNDPGETREKERDQAWDFNNWHETEPSEPGSFSWTENEEAWTRAEEERIKAEKEREERADSERRRRRAKRRADRDEEQKRINDARIPAQQKKLSEKITSLDEEIARLKAISSRSAPTSEIEDQCRIDGEATDTVDHFAIKLNRRRRLLGEALNIHHHLCRAQRSNGQANKAKDAERELAKAREDLAFRLADEFAREEENQGAGSASLNKERVRMQQQCHQSDQEKERALQEQHDNSPALGNLKPNGCRITVEDSEVEEIWPREPNVYVLRSKPEEQADMGENPVPMQLRYRRIYDWLGQLVHDEGENEAPGEHTKENTEHPVSPTRPTQASLYPVDDISETPISNQNPCCSPSQSSHNIIDSKPEPLIPDLSQHSTPPQNLLGSVNGEPHPPIPPPNRTFFFPFGYPSPINSKPGPRSSSPNSDALKTDNETFISSYLQRVHKSHLEVHGEFWDFTADDEVNCDYCGGVLPVLKCPRCNLRACSECKNNRGKRSCDNMWEWK